MCRLARRWALIAGGKGQGGKTEGERPFDSLANPLDEKSVQCAECMHG